MFSRSLRRIRGSLDISQKELAKRANITQGAISKYESGSDKPSFDMAVKIADALNCSLDDLAERSPYVNNKKETNTHRIFP